MPTVTQVNDLKINKLTKAQYDAAVQAGTIGENEISIITDLDATPQVDSLPTAGASQVGKIYQYIGATDSNYTNGYFYKCTEFADSATGEQTYGSGLTDISVTNIDTFANAFETGFGVAVFGTVIDFEYEGSGWMVTTEIDGQSESIFDQNIADWAVTFTGTPQNADTISITYTKPAAAYGWENIEVQPAGDSLPDQTGNAGKFLTTDGTDASWGKEIPSLTVKSNSPTSASTIEVIGDGSNQIAFKGSQINQGTIYGINGGGLQFYIWSPSTIDYRMKSDSFVTTGASVTLGSSTYKWSKLYTTKINNGADITVPNQAGTMVVADSTSATAGQVLTLDSNLQPVWQASSGGVPTLTWYTISTAGTTLTIADTSSAQLVKIYKNGLLLQPTEDYTISGTTLTTVSAMVVGDKITTEVF